MKTALTTDEVRLRLTVAPVGKTAYRASLAGMPGVNGYDLDTESLSLILKKPLELGKAPRVKPSFGFAPPCLDSSADIGEVFNHDSSASGYAFQEGSREKVVAIPSEALFTPSEASKVSQGTLRAVGLECLSQAESPFGDFLPVAASVKVVIRTNGRASHAEVYPDSLPVRSERNIGQFNDNMQVKPPLAVYQVGGGYGRADSIISIFWQGEGDVLPTGNSGKVDGIGLPIHFERVQIVAWRAIDRLGVSDPESFLSLGYSRLNRLGSLLASLNMQVRDKSGISLFAISVSQSMKCVGIAITLFPTCAADRIKRLGKLLNRLIQSFSLFWSRIKSHSYCSIHTNIIPYFSESLQIIKKEAGQFLCQINQAVPLP